MPLSLLLLLPLLLLPLLLLLLLLLALLLLRLLLSSLLRLLLLLRPLSLLFSLSLPGRPCAWPFDINTTVTANESEHATTSALIIPFRSFIFIDGLRAWPVLDLPCATSGESYRR